MAKPDQRGGAGARAGAFGILLIDKPAGPTSHDVVGWVRWALHERSVGHCGTLDPGATGLLVVCVGPATKLVEYLTAVDKRYLGRFVLGRSTTTDDADGETLEEVALAPDSIDRAVDAVPGMAGALEIAPPAYSAVKVDGRRAHALARAGQDLELEPRPMFVDHIEVAGRGADWVDADLIVSKGTYVRSLAQELGRRVGVPAHLGGLHRTACGSLNLDDPLAVTGLCAYQLPELEGRAPRWRVDVPEPGETEQPDRDPDRAQARAAALLRAHLAPAWQRLPFSGAELDAGTAHVRLVERLRQGQRLRADAHNCAALGLPNPPPAGLNTLVDRARGHLLVIRYEPEQDRLAPVRFIPFSVAAPEPVGP